MAIPVRPSRVLPADAAIVASQHLVAAGFIPNTVTNGLNITVPTNNIAAAGGRVVSAVVDLTGYRSFVIYGKSNVANALTVGFSAIDPATGLDFSGLDLISASFFQTGGPSPISFGAGLLAPNVPVFSCRIVIVNMHAVNVANLTALSGLLCSAS